jgi:poly(3-hydroxybutyrate) depolymerase
MRAILVRTSTAGPLLLTALLAAPLGAQQPHTLLGAPCTASADSPVTESGTGRTYLLDYPCDLREGEDVTFILSLHGGGSSGNWQRRYFPAFDQKERHRLVIAAPYSPIRRWTEDDDVYLQNIVTSITQEVGAENIRAFWLAGHSQGGQTSRRLVCTDFFARRVDGFLSLSGGRLGGAAPRASDAGRPRQANEPPPEPAAAAAAPATAAPAADPGCDFSHVFAIGQHEIASLPETSTWAGRLGCDARARRPDVVDDRPGYVHDGGRQNPGSRAWGLLPRPGTAEVFVYPGCDDGRVVADVVRIDKGHTEGLEPAVTEALVSLMVSASGGRIAGQSSTAQAAAPVDYSDDASWLCRPGRDDACAVDLDATVVRSDGTLSVERWSANPAAPIDCFYVYPTVSTDPDTNSDMSPDEAELRVIHQQFARFGSVCRPYAPSYRQITLRGLSARRSSDGATNLDQGLGYEDVRSAFRHYLANDNAGRGFVLIGHSQGARILARLVAEEIDGSEIRSRMISAILLGQTITVAEGRTTGGSFRTVPLCVGGPTEYGCVVTFSSFRSTAAPPANTLFGRTSVAGLRPACTDPTALAGTPGELNAYLSADGTTIIRNGREARPWSASGPAVETPFVSVPGLLTARCATNENATYLEVTVHGDPADPRADDITGDLTPQWGLHLIDVNLVMGNLLDIVSRQATMWSRSRPPAPPAR